MPEAVESLFTIVTEYQGATLVEQIRATGLNALLEKWKTQTLAPIRLSAEVDHLEFLSPLDGLVNAWCTTYRDDNEVFFLLQIIQTSDPERTPAISAASANSVIPFEPGQLWGYRKSTEESYSKVLILAVEELKGQSIVHLTVVDGNVDAPLHMPFSETAVRNSVTLLLEHTSTIPDFEDGYRIWKEAFGQEEAGIYIASIAEVLEM